MEFFTCYNINVKKMSTVKSPCWTEEVWTGDTLLDFWSLQILKGLGFSFFFCSTTKRPKITQTLFMPREVRLQDSSNKPEPNQTQQTLVETLAKVTESTNLPLGGSNGRYYQKLQITTANDYQVYFILFLVIFNHYGIIIS